MKDGRMVQLATPEELVLNPADDYVAEFARNAPHQRIISVGAVMEPVDPGAVGEVRVDAKIGEVAEQVLRADKPVGVVDAEGRMVGSINRGDIATALFSRQDP
jgi:glycine betaine/proline transport system ATP-binding protein